MIRISHTEVLVDEPRSIATLREDFDRHQCVVLTGFIDHALLRYIETQLTRTRFVHNVPRSATGAVVARELRADEAAPLPALFPLLLNRPALFRVVERITGCGHIGHFYGRLFRREPDTHRDVWHDDRADHRLIGMSINLTSMKYEGGAFQLRDRRAGRTLCEVSATSYGDAHVFRVASHLEHRVTPVRGRVARTAYAGWFCSEPHYAALFREIYRPRLAVGDRGEGATDPR